MKKYIKPIQKVYSVSTCEMIALSLNTDTNSVQSNGKVYMETKEEKTSDIWNLYE